MQIHQDIVERHLNNLRAMQTDSGLFTASRQDVSTGYNKAWLRDNFYTCIAFEEIEDWERVKKVWKSILSIFIKHKDKINWAVDNKPFATYQYIHARYNPETFEEFWEEWGNKQNDCIGEILFKVGELEEKGVRVVESEEEKAMVQTLINYLSSIQYWQDPDNGIWEEYEEVHASSIGTCVAGLKKIRKLHFTNVPLELIEKGEEALRKLLPRESVSKFSDLALLSLIYPFDVVPEEVAREIVRKIEYHLKRDRGVIRYKNDRYYNKNKDGYSEEAEWCFGFPWLSIIYDKWGKDQEKFGDITDTNDRKRANEYLEKSFSIIKNDQVPELYFSDSPEHNDNTPLAWSESLFLVALLRAGK